MTQPSSTLATTTHSVETSAGGRFGFGFGANWARILRHLDEPRNMAA
jgi:hypothetical protein